MRVRRVNGPIDDSVEIESVIHCEVHAGFGWRTPFRLQDGGRMRWRWPHFERG